MEKGQPGRELVGENRGNYIGRKQVLPNELLDLLGKLDEEQLLELSSVIQMTLEQKEEEEEEIAAQAELEDDDDDEEEEDGEESTVDIDTKDI